MINDKFARLRAKLGGLEDSSVGRFDPLSKTYVTANSTKKEPSLHAVNKLVEAKLTETRSAADIVAGLQRKEFVAEEWIPDAYVLFTRRWKCQCGMAGSCLDRPELFLRHRHIRQRKGNANEPRDNDPGLRYLPVKVLAYPTLPRLKEVAFRSLSICESCFEKKDAIVSCPPPRQLPSVQVDIATNQEEKKEDLLESAFLRKRAWNMGELEADWLQYQSTGLSLDPSVFASSSSVPSALAKDTTSPINEDRQSA